MATRSNSSRERILSCAEAIILKKGFSATTLEDIFKDAAITKGGFFYHFDGKEALAEALVLRYLEQDDAIFEELSRQADALSEDPLHRLLIFLKLLSEMMGNMHETHPGCLVASFTYENYQLNDHIGDLMRLGISNWNRMIMARLEQINEQYETSGDTTPETLAYMFTGIIEGGILLARNFSNNQLLANQILAYRSFIRLIYGAK